LNPIAPPNIIPYYYGKVKEDIGISAFILLEGGHVTIHTFPKRECYFIDCFTQRDFDEEFLYDYLYKSLPFDKELSIFLLFDTCCTCIFLKNIL
jgi:S-adenosylmethionine/arginine decarboxylase-like enzyme